jgi:hypothetical protein
LPFLEELLQLKKKILNNKRHLVEIKIQNQQAGGLLKLINKQVGKILKNKRMQIPGEIHKHKILHVIGIKFNLKHQENGIQHKLRKILTQGVNLNRNRKIIMFGETTNKSNQMDIINKMVIQFKKKSISPNKL